MDSWSSTPALPPVAYKLRKTLTREQPGIIFQNDLRVFQKALFIEIRNPHATPRHRISEKQCPESNLGSLFLNDLGAFQKAFFIEIRQGPYIRVSLIEIRAQTGGVANLWHTQVALCLGYFGVTKVSCPE